MLPSPNSRTPVPDSLKMMWEGVRMRKEEVEVEIFSIKVGEKDDRSSQPRN